MKTHKHKSEKIHHVVHKNERKLNLHEIKKETGAGNGHKDIHHNNNISKQGDN